jgi:hypothetical protein
MSLIKLGQSLAITPSDFRPLESILADEKIVEQFSKFANTLKVIAPKAQDFLYFSAIMMHAAEASLLGPNGTLKKDASGKDLTSSWEKKGESWRWICNDPSVKPYKNSNGDIFPEEELIKAHKNWVGKPLCLDHKSSSVEMVRGLIVDTYYDHISKRVVALCALDKINYPDLARKVSTGYTTCVSMGTAVEKAICTDCGTVARVEADFCDCMRQRRCYGEINIGLNPIELSIVVTGADPQAKIRHIIAAKNHIASYVSAKELEFSKLGSEKFDLEKIKNITSSLEKIESELQTLKTDLTSLQDSEEQEVEAEAEKQASTNVTSDDLRQIFSSLETLSNRVNKLYQLNNSDEEHNMTTKTAYFQGAGGVNEPTPGKPKYEKEEADSIRGTQDKQMVGQMNMGPVDGMHPGYESFGESEEARKKRLQRMAEKEARQLQRQAAYQKAKEKLGYFQGGGDVNEPTPGKPKYEKEDAESIRDKEDKQMVGQAPFPGVGAVDGLHPSPASSDQKDELKRKQMLSRASKLTAKFVKAANSDGSDNLGQSRWDVFSDKKLILSATVQDITGNKVDVLYDAVANEGFAKKLLARVRSEGVEKVASQLKTAQAVPPAPMPEMPMEMPAPEPLTSEVKDEGGSGDPKEMVPELLNKVENTVADLRKGFEALTEQSGNELTDLNEKADQGALPPSMASSLKLQKTLTKALAVGFKKAESELTELAKELKYAQAIYQSKKISASDKTYVNQLVSETIKESQDLLSDSYRLIRAFAKYARGTEQIVKKATQYTENMKTAQQKPAMSADPLDPTLPGQPGEVEPVSPVVKPVVKSPVPKPSAKPVDMRTDKEKMEQMTPDERAAEIDKMKAQRGDRSGLETMMTNVTRESPLSFHQTPTALPPFGQDKVDADDNDLKMLTDGTLDGPGDEIGKAMKASKASASYDLTTKEGRAEFRAKQAQKATAWSDMLGKAHGKGGVTTKLDTKPTGDLAKVETLEEVNKAMVDVAMAPPKVKKAAEDIQKLVLAGKLDPAKDFPELLSLGLDKDAVSYWKSFYGQAKDGGSEFAAELVKERGKVKAAEEMEQYRVKVARAYELTYDMVSKGQCDNNRPAIKQQVDEIMKMNEDGFNSIKRYVSRLSPTVKTAMPIIGQTNFIQDQAPQSPESSDLSEMFSKAFANKRY